MTEEENDDESYYKEIAERDKLIYDSISYRYNLEWDLSKILDGKASGIISFVGIILALQGALGAILLEDAPRKNALFIPIMCLFIFSILYLTISILSGLKAYYLKEWNAVPKADYLIEEYGKKNRSRTYIMRTMGQEMANSIKKNSTNNNEKKRFIEYGFIFLVSGLVVDVIFIIGLIIIKYAKG